MARPSVQLVSLVVLSAWLLAPARAADPQAPRATPTPTPTPRSPGASKPKAGATAKPSEPDFAALAKKAEEHRAAGRIDEAIALYRRALARNPAWAEGLWYLGTLLYEKDQFVEAREALRRLVALTPRVGAPWALLGLSEFQSKEYAQALEHLQKSRELGVGSNEALIQVARYHTAILLTRFGGFTNATDLLVGLARSQPDTEDLALALGLNILRRPLLPTELPPAERPLVVRAGRAAYLQAVGRHQEARRAFEQLRTENGAEPGVAETYREFLVAYPKALSDPALREPALRELRNEVAQAPEGFEANLYLGLLLKDSSPAEAAACLEKAHAARPQAPEPAYELARLRLAEGQTERARELLEAAVAQGPAFSEGHVLLASVYYRLNRRADGDRERDLARQGTASRDESSSPAAATVTAPRTPDRFDALARQAAAAREAERL
ncbi:MAG TPA: tetratricopeptide repeat protein, partial [Vicinamibacteria bacterium]